MAKHRTILILFLLISGAQLFPLAAATPCDAPTNVTVTGVTSTTVSLSWTQPFYCGTATYYILAGYSSGAEANPQAQAGTTSGTYTGLFPGSTVYLQVQEQNSGGPGVLSAEVSANTLGPPSAPQSLSASAGVQQVSLSWSAPASNGGAAVTSYNVLRGTSSGTESQLGSGGCSGLGNVLSCTDTGLSAGTTYYYIVKAVNSVGASSASNEASATPTAPPNTVPGAPPNLAASFGNTQILLTWDAANNGGSAITAYKVYRSTTSGTETLRTTLGNVLQFTDTGLTNNQIYYYKVSAVNSVGEGSLSNEASATPRTPPSTPTGLTATPGNTQAVLTWNAVTLQPGGGYYAQRSTTNGCNFGAGCGFLLNSGSLITGTTFTDTGLTNGVTYYYRVYASDSYGNSPQSAQASATPAPPTVPSAPQSLTATAGVQEVTLAWGAPASNGGAAVTSYNVLRGTTPGGESQVLLGPCNGLGNILTCTDTGLTAGTTYYYVVKAVNSAGASAASNEANATPTSNATVPGVPPNLAASFGNAQILLTWDAANNGGSAITAYKVYRSTTSGTETLLTTLGNVLQFTDTGLTNNQIYYYKVSAFNSVGEGNKSTEANATPQSPPATPTGLTATPGNTQAVLTWSSVALQPGGGYYALRGTTSGFAIGNGYGLNNGQLITTTTITDTGLTNGVPYYYKIYASDSHGNSPLSAEATATPTATATTPTTSPASTNTSRVIDGAVGTSFPFILGLVFIAAGLAALGMVLGRLRSF